MSIEAV